MERAQIIVNRENTVKILENMTKEDCFKFNVVVMKNTLRYFGMLKRNYRMYKPFPPHQEEYARILDSRRTRDIETCIESMIYFSEKMFQIIKNFEELFASEIAIAKMVKDEDVGL